MTQIALRIGGAADAGPIAALATQVFLDTYAADGIRPDLAREAFSVYAEDRFAERLAEPGRRFIVAERGTGLVGFAELLLAPRAAMPGGNVGAELVRLYVQPAAQGSGLGARLMREAERVAREAGRAHLWLTAWTGNARALAFYRTAGYRDIGATRYEFEGQAYENRIFSRPLDP